MYFTSEFQLLPFRKASKNILNWKERRQDQRATLKRNGKQDVPSNINKSMCSTGMIQNTWASDVSFLSRKHAWRAQRQCYTNQPHRDRSTVLASLTLIEPRLIQTIVKARLRPQSRRLKSRSASAESEDTNSRFTKTTLAFPEEQVINIIWLVRFCQNT